MNEIYVDTTTLERRMRGLQQQIGEFTELATLESLKHIHEVAMNNLDISVQGNWGHSVDVNQQIKNSVNMDTEVNLNKITGVLSYSSPHARLQEYGDFYIYNRDPSEGPMPIGKQEGNIVGFGYKIIGSIQGKYFLTRAFMSEVGAVNDIFQKYKSLLSD